MSQLIDEVGRAIQYHSVGNVVSKTQQTVTVIHTKGGS